jgi:aquaporin Z
VRNVDRRRASACLTCEERDMRDAWRRHWPEYAMEALGLGLFMLSATGCAIVLFHPVSPVLTALPSETGRRAVMGLAMGLTAIALVYSPWGRRSGAHLNPAVTLTFFRLGKVAGPDAVCYALAQAAGGLAGMLLGVLVFGAVVAHPAVNYVVTVPGPRGIAAAFAGEVAISLGLMTVVLVASNTARLAPYTGCLAGLTVATWITVEAPLSGMSMNPARTLASAAPAGVWTAFWIYVTAPALGMLAAAELYVRLLGRRARCAKLHHDGRRRCIFRCGYAAAPAAGGD